MMALSLGSDRRRTAWATAIASALLLLALPAGSLSTATNDGPVLPPDPVPDPAALRALSGAGFTENVGQVGNGDVRFYAASAGMQVGFVPSGVLFRLVGQSPSETVARRQDRTPAADTELSPMRRGVLLRLTFEGANIVVPEGNWELPHRSHFFLGNDPAEWHTDVRSYREVIYENLYEGIDLIYRVTNEGLKYDFLVHPGASPGQIAAHYEGANSLMVEDDSALILRTVAGDLHDSAPVALQEDGSHANCAFAVRDARSFGFDCTGWDGLQDLRIDPLVYSTYLGATGMDFGGRMAVANGEAYIVGQTQSMDFPIVPGAFDASRDGPSDLFVAKLSTDGSSLVFSTFVGGSGDEGYDLALFLSGTDVFVTGDTTSADFPVTMGAFDTTFNGGGSDAYVAQINWNGSNLVYSTYLGGAGYDGGRGLSVEGASVYVSVHTSSLDFPTTPGAFDTTYDGGHAIGTDAAIVKLNTGNSSLEYSTYLGGSHDEFVGPLVVAAGEAYVTGYTFFNVIGGPAFPTTPGAFDTTFGGGSDIFLSRLNATGSGLVFSTFLGGAGGDGPGGLAVDGGNAYVTGSTDGADYPTTLGAMDVTINGGRDCVVSELTADGSGLVYSTFLGGSGDDVCQYMSITNGEAVVTGNTAGGGFPTTVDAFDASHNGNDDAFVARLSADGSSLVYSTFLGGSDADVGGSVVWVNPLFVAGVTGSADFPTTAGAFDTTFGGGTWDLFVAKLKVVNAAPVANAGPDQVTVRNATVTLNGSASFDPDGDPITFNWTQVAGPNALTITNANASVASVVPTMVGTYTFNLTVTDNETASAYDWVDVNVTNQAPIADAGPLQVAFENTLVTLNGIASSDPDGDPLGYNWTQAGGPLPVILANPDTATPTFTTPNGAFAAGAYTFTLTVADPFGANDSGDGFVMVMNRPPIADAGPDQNIVGKFSVVTLDGSNSSDPDGEPITHFWWQTGGPAVTFTAQTSSITDFTAVGAGVYTFDLFVNDPEDTNVSDAVTVNVDNAPPTAALAVTPNPVPVGTDADVDASASSDGDGTIVQYNFTFGDGTDSGNVTTPSVTHAWAAPGVYEVNVTVSDDDGASHVATVLVTVVVDLPPTAVAAVTPGTTGDLSTVFSFDASGSLDDNGIVAWLWDFGDGNTASTEIAPHAYTSRGSFLVTLTVWDVFNQNDTDTLTIDVLNRPPIADAGPDQNTVRNATVTLNGSASFDPDADAIMYLWTQVAGPNFVPIANATADVASVVPTMLGTYTFSLTVSDSVDSSFDLVDILVLNQIPIASAGSDQIVPKKIPVQLNATLSSDPDLDTLSFAWSLVSGPAPVTLTGANTATPTFTPPTSGVYTFEVNVSDGLGGYALDTVDVNATNGPPVANAGPDQSGFLKRVLVTLNGTLSADPDLDTLSFLWSQTAGPTETLAGNTTANPTFTPALAGVYAFRLDVGDLDGGTDSDTVLVDVQNQPPTAALVATPTSAVVGVDISFDGSASSDPDGTIANWTLQFGDGSANGAGPPPAAVAHAYAAAGPYDVTLFVTDDDGDMDTATVPVTITAVDLPPTAVAAVTPSNTGNLSTMFNFDASGSSDDVGIVGYVWEFGDGSLNGTGVTATHTYTSRGTFQVNLTVTDTATQTARTTLAIQVQNRPPTANAGANQTNIPSGTLVTLTGSGSDPDDDALTYDWTMVSGPAQISIADVASPTFTPTVAGTYVFSLVVRDGTNSSAADTVTIIVEAPPVPPPQDDTALIVAAILAILVLFGLFALLARRRRKEPGEDVEAEEEEGEEGEEEGEESLAELEEAVQEEEIVEEEEASEEEEEELEL